MSQYHNLLLVAIQAALDAGKAILNVYHSPIKVQYKDDQSPLTEADQAAHEIIAKTLREATPETPILSEEGRAIPYEERRQWKCFWLVDPLDGTKEFIKRNGEFTVNIALIEEGEPVLGVIYVPCRDHLYFACKGVGSFKVDRCVELPVTHLIEKLINSSKKLPLGRYQPSEVIRVVGSRSHGSEAFEAYIRSLKLKYKTVDIAPAGSSLKFCLVAEGNADIYPRLGPTMEWDTAAGQTICEEAGCMVHQWETELPLSYNKANLLNPFFTVQRCPSE